MSTELESRLRQDLAAVQVEIPVDLERTLSSGHRAVTARRIGWGIGVLALVVGAAVLMPKTLPERIPAVPAPLETPSPGQATVTFDPQTFSSSEITIELDAATLELRRDAGGAIEVTAMVALNGEAPLRGTFTADPDNTWTDRLGDQVMIGLAPTNRWVDWLLDGTEGSFFSTQQVEPFGLTAYLLFAEPTDPPWTVRGAIWQQPNGEVRNSLGERVSAAELLGRSTTIYVDPTLDVVGVRLAAGGSTGNLSEVEADQLARAGSIGSSDASGTWTTNSHELYLVPEDAVGDVVATRWIDAAEVEMGTLEGGSWAGRMFVWASLKHAKDEEPEGLLRSVSYRNAAGEVIAVQIRR